MKIFLIKYIEKIYRVKALSLFFNRNPSEFIYGVTGLLHIISAGSFSTACFSGFQEGVGLIEKQGCATELFSWEARLPYHRRTSRNPQHL